LESKYEKIEKWIWDEIWMSIPYILWNIKSKFGNIVNNLYFLKKDKLTKEDLEEIYNNREYYTKYLDSHMWNWSFKNKFIEIQQDFIEKFILEKLELQEKLFIFRDWIYDNEKALKIIWINQSFILENPLLICLCFYYIRKYSKEFFTYNLANALYLEWDVWEGIQEILWKIKAKSSYEIKKDKEYQYNYQEVEIDKKFDYFSQDDLKIHKNIFENILNLEEEDFLKLHEKCKNYDWSIEYYICDYIYNLVYKSKKIKSNTEGENKNYNIDDLFEDFLFKWKNRSIWFLSCNWDIFDNKEKTIDPFVFLKVIKYFKNKDKFIELFKPFYVKKTD
jgi:hypothetical protein